VVKVSIIIPVYNVGEFLGECLDSVINQTLHDIEIICINDGSTDNSLDILNKYAENDTRINIITKKNEGQGIARNIGIDKAQGEYIGFVDPDDWIDLNMYEEMYNAAVRNDANVVLCNNYTIKEGKIELWKKNFTYTLEKDKVIKPYSMVNYMDYRDRANILRIEHAPWRKLYKTSFLKENDIKFAPYKKAEDQPFAIDVNLSSPVFYINKPLYYYRIRKESCTRALPTLGKEIADAAASIVKKNHMENLLKNELDEYVVWRYMISYKKLYINSPVIFLISKFNELTKDQFILLTKKVFDVYFKELPDNYNKKDTFLKLFLKISKVKSKKNTHIVFSIFGIKMKFKY